MIKTANLTGPVSRAAGGLYESVRRLVQELQLTGLEVSVLGTFDDFTQDDISAWDPITVRAFIPVGPKQFGYSPGYQEFLKLYRPEILHTHGIWIYSSIATHRYSQIHRVPYMISPHGMLDPWAVRNSYWKKWIARHLYEDAHLRDATCLRALCDSEAQAFRTYGLKNPTVLIPNGIDLPEEDQSSDEGRGTRVKGNHGGRKKLLFLGRIHPKKGLPNALNAFKNAIDSLPSTLDSSWQFVIAGWDQGGHEGELMQLCKAVGMSVERRASSVEGRQSDAEVLFWGPAFKEEKDSLLRSADAFILPSFSEGLPMSVLEAWAYGLPVVMTPECNLPEGFTADAAIQVGTGTESIADGLNALFSMSVSDLEVMGNKGRNLVKDRFTWKAVAAQMREVYDWMLGGGTTPSSVVMNK